MAWARSCERHSCEPTRKTAYSEDLRWRMVWQREVQGLTLDKVAANLCVDTSTVHRIVKQFETSGSVQKKASPDRNPPVKLTRPVQLTILHLVLEKPGIYLWEVQRDLQFMYDLEISASSICNCLKRSNFSRTKMQLVALQRDQELRATFTSDVSVYQQHSLVFIDETGCDRRDSLRKYGYGLRGKRVKSQKLLVRGKRVSVIAAMTTEGILDLKIVHDTVTGEIFTEFVQKQLLPRLMTFDGINPNSVTILDNCSVHHVHGVEAIEEVGALIHYLPPYSPDFNPIELLFSKVKSVIRQMETEVASTGDIDDIILSAFCSVTPQDCQSWINSCAIYT